MGLVKAKDVEFQTPLVEADDTPLDFDDLAQSDADSDFEMGAPVLIGGSQIDFESLELSPEALGQSIFFADGDTEIIMGEAVTIGGRGRTVADADVAMPDYDAYGESESYEMDYQEPADLAEPEEAVDTSQMLIENFASGMQQAQPDTSEAEAWARQKQTTMMGKIDDKVRLMMDEQRLAMKEQSEEQIFSISSAQKQRLLSEAMQGIQDAAEPGNYEAIINEITQYIEDLSLHQREKLIQELEEQRVENIHNVEDYIKNTLDRQREAMMQEASEYIAVTIENYKQQLNEDNEFIKAANQIISQREHMLDEGYTKSLKMVQEAEGEASRIMEEAYTQQDRANELLAEAEAQAEMMTQEAQAEAERIIAEANMESARIIEAAEQSHQEIVEAATQDGFNVGYQEGREEAIKENAQLLMETTNALNKLHAAFPQAVKQNEDKLIKLALEIARDVIQEELSIRPELCIKSVQRAITKVSDLEKVLIKVNPLDLDLILPKQEYFRSLLPDVQDFVITGHYSINRGGCLIETNSGTIDAQINTQLAVVEEVFGQIRSEYDYSEDEDAAHGEEGG